MTILSLRFNKKNIQDYELVRGQQLSIGRNPDNDIALDNMAVSGYHAFIESVAANFVIRDLDSTNGIFVNNKKIKMHVLQHNDVIMIGQYEFVFNRQVSDRDAQDQSPFQDEAYFDDKTRFLDTKEYKDLIRKATGEAEEEQETPPPPVVPEQKQQEEEIGLLARFWQKFVGLIGK